MIVHLDKTELEALIAALLAQAEFQEEFKKLGTEGYSHFIHSLVLKLERALQSDKE